MFELAERLYAGRNEDRGAEQRELLDCVREWEEGNEMGNEKGRGVEGNPRVRVKRAQGALALVERRFAPGEVESRSYDQKQ